MSKLNPITTYKNNIMKDTAIKIFLDLDKKFVYINTDTVAEGFWIELSKYNELKKEYAKM